MKPIDLYNAMEGIPEQYIEAAKPAAKRKGESRAVTTQTVRAAEPVSSRPRAQKRHNRKDNIRMSTIHPVWQRIMTGFAAAAACTVFVGGAWFIAQQAKQNNQQEDDSNTRSVRNFLGGTGAVHAASGLDLMYDDNKVYFGRAMYEADLNSGETGSLQMHEYCDSLYWDGEQFYRAEDNALYRIDMTGAHMDDKPFYSIDTAALEKQFGAEITDTFFYDVRKLADGCYFIDFSVSAMPDTEINWDKKSYACIYQPETGQQDSIPNSTNVVPHLAANGSEIVAVNYDNSMYRITLDPVKIEAMGSADTFWNYNTSRIISDGGMYFMAYNDEEDEPHLSYGKIDLNTLEYTELLHEPGFRSFIPDGNQFYAINTDGSELICAEPDLSGYGVVSKFTSSLSEAQQNAVNTLLSTLPDGQTPEMELIGVDDNYFAVVLSGTDTSCGFALIDRKTDKVQIFTENGTADSTEQTAARNVLGGTGALHATTYDWMLYDDSNVYFECGTLRGSRNPAEQISATEENVLPAGTITSDGKDLYMAEKYSLYRLDSTGNPEAEPFFTISEETIESFRQAHHGNVKTGIFRIERLTEPYYHVTFELIDYEADLSEDSYRSYSILYNAETKECRDTPRNDYDLDITRCVKSGDDFYCIWDDTSFARFNLDDYEFETIPTSSRICSDTFLVQDDSIYFQALNKDMDHSQPVYSKFDFSTKTTEVITETPDFTNFIPNNGMIYTTNKACTQIFCTDPELKTKTVLYDYAQDTPEQIQTAVNALDDIICLIPSIDCVDENYLCTRLATGTFLVLDLHTGKAHFYQPADSTDIAQDVQTQTTPDTNSDEENVFGGWGTLYPVDWDTHSTVTLFRDDINYYFFDAGKWYRCPLAGGQKEQLPARINGAQAPQESFISDGERVYTRDMVVLSEGSAANAFDPAQVRAYLNELNNTADNGRYYECLYIWHIKNRYFIQITDGYAGSIEVWTDENGSILSHKNAEAGTEMYFCNGEKTEMQSIKNGYLNIIDCPGDPVDEKPDPLAFGKILDAYLSMDESYFYTREHDLYTFDENGQKALITEVAFENPKLAAAPDHRFFYVNMDPLNFSVREWIGGSQDNEIYAPEPCSELRICGFEQTGNGKYNIVLYRNASEDTSYVFVDAATGQAVKTIQ